MSRLKIIGKVLIVSFLMTCCFSEISLANEIKGQQVNSHEPYTIKGLVFNEQLMTLDFGKPVDLHTIQSSTFYNASKQRLDKFKIEVITNRNVKLTHKEIQQVKYIKMGNEFVEIKSDKALEDSKKIYLVKEKCRFLDNNNLLLQFTQPIDINSLKLLPMSTKGKLYYESKVEYYCDMNGFTDYKRVRVNYSGLIGNEVYVLQVSDGIRGFLDNKVDPLNGQLTVKIVHDAIDYTAPQLLQCIVKSKREVSLKFSDMTDLALSSINNLSNYKITKDKTGEQIPIISGVLSNSESDGKINEIVLKTPFMELDSNYTISFDKVADLNGNETSGKAPFTFFDYDEKGPRLLNIEPINSSLLRLVFNKEVFIPSGYATDNVLISSNVKVISVVKDPIIRNGILVKTSLHENRGSHRLSIEGIEDKYGELSKKQYCSQSYTSIVEKSRKFDLVLLENTIILGQSALTATFNESVGSEIDQKQDLFSIKGLDILYYYRLNDKQIRIVTSPQNKGEVYTLIINGINSIYGNNSDVISKSFAGVVIE